MGAAKSMKQNIGIWKDQGKSERWYGKQDVTEKEDECGFTFRDKLSIQPHNEEQLVWSQLRGLTHVFPGRCSSIEMKAARPLAHPRLVAARALAY